ncbi:MAG TPA: dockerin [Clostridium sp.]|nr:dockerin [Clostridium sp.]
MKKKICSLLVFIVLLTGITGLNVVAQSGEVLRPIFSQQGGFYTQPFMLHLSTQDQNARIYYTTDGSVPTPGSEGTFEYSGGIQIQDKTEEPNDLSMISNISSDRFQGWIEPKGQLFKGTVVRAVAVNQGGAMSSVVTQSYFVDPNGIQRYRLPVISVVTDRDNLFDNQIGIYVNGNYENRGEEWERPVHIEFFEENGSLAFSQNAGIRIHGGYTRNYAQKSFRLYAREEYDEQKWFEYNFFPGLKGKGTGESLQKFKRLLLRMSGNDSQYTMFRDGLMQGLVSHLNVDTQAFRATVLFLNGEFWGIYNVRERYDDRYFQGHYDLDRKNVALLSIVGSIEEVIDVDEGTEEDAQDYRNIVNYIRQNNIKDKSTYGYLNTKIDIDSYIDYLITHIYFANTDWPANNQALWKYKTDNGQYNPNAPKGQDGRWRWAIKDTDFGFGLAYGGQVNHNTLLYASSEGRGFGAAPDWSVFLFKTLLENDDFRNNFINRFADHINTTFVPERVNEMIDQKSDDIAHIIEEHNRRWNKIEGWDKEVRVLRDFADRRPSYVINHIVNRFKDNGVLQSASINLSTEIDKGFIRINSIDINEKTPGVKNPAQWSGVYFEGVPVTIKAIPNEGYKFEKWEGINDDIYNDTITINPQNNMNIRAVFKKTSTDEQVVGDLNGDKIVNSADYVLLQRYVLDISDLKLEDKFGVTDLNLDGRINSIDCAILKRYILDIITLLPHK